MQAIDSVQSRLRFFLAFWNLTKLGYNNMLQSVSIFSLKRYIFVFLPHTATHSQPSHSYTQQAITQLHTASHRNIYTLVPHHTATAQNCDPARKPRRRRKIEIFVSKIASKNNHFVTNYCPFGQLCWNACGPETSFSAKSIFTFLIFKGCANKNLGFEFSFCSYLSFYISDL